MIRKLLIKLIRFLLHLVADIHLEGLENIPQDASTFAIASNHLGILDAFVTYIVFQRQNVFIPVAEKWERVPVLRWLGKHLNWVFIDRFNPDIAAIRESLSKMRRGETLVIAPEGTRSRAEVLQEGKPGVAYLAIKAGYPIIPVALIGTEDRLLKENLKRLRRTPITVRVGKPFTLPPLHGGKQRDADLRASTDEIMCRIAAMMPEKYHGHYAGHPRLQELLAEARQQAQS